jgi:putative DNA primase/helicase
VTADAIAAGLGARRTGSTWMAPCPAHKDRTPSLSITENANGKPLFRCHAGCEQAAVIAALKSRGLWDGAAIELTPEQVAQAQRRAVERAIEEAEKKQRAIEIWRCARPIFNTPADEYLRSRCILPDALLYPSCGSHWPETLRWSDDVVARLDKPPCPGLVCAINDSRSGLVVAVQRIFFGTDGQPARDRDGNRIKKVLGPLQGNAYHGSMWPDEQGCWGIAEGIESALSATQLFRYPVAAAISSSNMPNVTPPSWARHVTIFADNDANGVGFRAADNTLAALRGTNSFEAIRVLQAERVGEDFNDVLQRVTYGS